MVNAGFFFLLQNIFLVTALFWLLSFLGSKFFKNFQKNLKNEIFECGFFSNNKLNIKFSINYYLTAVLLIIYDIEFFFLIPILFNFNQINLLTLFVIIVFILLVFISFFFDWKVIGIDWVI